MNLPFKVPKSFYVTKKFEKQAKRLDSRIQKQIASVIDEFKNEEIRPGRKVHKVDGYSNRYSVRLTDKYRLIYEYSENEKETGTLIIADGHEEAYKAP